MTTFFITSDAFFDDPAFSTRTGSDTYNISALARFEIDVDTRYNAQSTAVTGNLGNVPISATEGGEIFLNGERVRIVPFTDGSGVVPAYGTGLTDSVGTFGEFAGVWSAFNVPPVAPGGAMPADGWIKLRSVQDPGWVAGAVGGLAGGATATGTGRVDIVGWIEVVGIEALSITCPRTGRIYMRGAWFEHPTLTSGSRASTYQLPASLANTYYPGVWVEKTPGSAGTDDDFEFYPATGTLTGVGVIATDYLRGRVCWISSQGLVRLGSDGTNDNGYLPDAGCRIRVPNIVTLNATGAAPQLNAVPNTTLTTRYDFPTAQNVDIEKANLAWYPSMSTVYSVRMKDVGILDQMAIGEVQTAPYIDNVGIGQSAALNIACCALNYWRGASTEPAVINNCVFTRPSLGVSAFIMTMGQWINCNVTNCRFIAWGNRSSTATGPISMTYCRDMVFDGNTLGTPNFTIGTGCENISFLNTTYFDLINATTTLTTNGGFVYLINGAATGLYFRGIDIPMPMLGPYAALFSITAAGINNMWVTDIGSPTDPIEFGGPRVADTPWTRVTTVMTVQSVGHGLKVGDTVVFASISGGSQAPISNPTTLVVQTVPTADTFTVTVSNAGNASGTCSYFPVLTSAIATLNGGNVACWDIFFQRIWAAHSRSALFAEANDTFRIQYQNCYIDLAGIVVLSNDHGYHPGGGVRGLRATNTLAAASGVVGTHWLDWYSSEFSPVRTGASYTRSTTLMTITSPGHQLVTGNFIFLPVEIPLTARVNVYAVTVLTDDTFLITVQNAGPASGTIDFLNASGRLAIMPCEPTIWTAPSGGPVQAAITGGTPVWTGVGSVYMPTPGDEVTWETPDYVLGYTGFLDAPIIFGGAVLARYDVLYQLDKNDGYGFGSWKNISYVRTGLTGVGGSFIANVLDTTGVNVGDRVTGTNVGTDARVQSVDSSTQLTLTVANLGSLSANAQFQGLGGPVDGLGCVSATLGFKLRLKVTTVIANAQPLLNAYISLEADEASRAAGIYPATGLVPATPAPAPNTRSPRGIIVPSGSRGMLVPELARAMIAPRVF